MTRNEKDDFRPKRGKRGQTPAEFKSKHDPVEEIRHLREQLNLKDREHDKYQKDMGGLRVLFDDIRDAIEAIEPPKIEYHRPSNSGSLPEVTHVCQWTDWHEGAIIDPEEIEGFNKFDPQVLRAYLRNCVDDQLNWVDLSRKSYLIDTCHNLCTGDYISGGIHPELLITNAYPEPVQAIRAGELLAETIARQAPYFARVIVDFITVDNHARLTKKPQASEAGINTWNYVVGFYAKERLRLLPNVEFNIHETIFKVVSCGGRRYLLTHGDRVRGWAGFPWYGLDRLVGREAVKRIRRVLQESRKPVVDVAKSIGVLFDRVVLGHWHAPLVHPWYAIGGSACGTTAYDHGEGRYAEPSQPSWLISRKHGEFARTDWQLHTDVP